MEFTRLLGLCRDSYKDPFLHSWLNRGRFRGLADISFGMIGFRWVLITACWDRSLDCCAFLRQLMRVCRAGFCRDPGCFIIQFANLGTAPKPCYYSSQSLRNRNIKAVSISFQFPFHWILHSIGSFPKQGHPNIDSNMLESSFRGTPCKVPLLLGNPYLSQQDDPSQPTS